MGLNDLTTTLRITEHLARTAASSADRTYAVTDHVATEKEAFGWFDITKPPKIQIANADKWMELLLKQTFGDNAVTELLTAERYEDGSPVLSEDCKPVMHDIYKDVAAWLTDNRNRGLLCYGGCGLGKSVLCGIVIPRIVHRATGCIVNCYKSYELNQKYETIANQRYVMIDDIGLEAPLKSYGNNLGYVFSRIVDNAEREGNLLILTSNLSLKALKDKYGDRTIDRLKALTKTVLFEGKSLRK